MQEWLVVTIVWYFSYVLPLTELFDDDSDWVIVFLDDGNKVIVLMFF